MAFVATEETVRQIEQQTLTRVYEKSFIGFIGLFAGFAIGALAPILAMDAGYDPVAVLALSIVAGVVSAYLATKGDNIPSYSSALGLVSGLAFANAMV